MQPLFENVLVRVDTREEKSGTYETVAKDEELLTGTVIAVGQGSVAWPNMAVKVGDRIRWHRNAGEKEMIDRKLHRFLNERKGDIIAIL